MQQPGGREESTGVQKDFAAGVVGGHDDGVGEAIICVESADRFADPCSGCDDFGFAGHVGQSDQHQPVACPCVLMQAAVRVRGEHHAQVGGAVEEALVVCREQGAGRIGARTPVVVGAQLDQEPFAVHREAGVGRRVDPDQLTGAQLVNLVVEEVDGAVDQRALIAGGPVHPA